jgi:hypothetical protein
MFIKQMKYKDLAFMNFLFLPFLATIRPFTVRKLAHILYECVECQEPRKGTDWLTAEKFVNDNLGEVRIGITAESFFPDYLEDRFQHPPDMTSLTSWNESEYQRLDRVLGRWVWDNFYQTMQKRDAIQPPYGKIKFH